jgi:gluconolactonase
MSQIMLHATSCRQIVHYLLPAFLGVTLAMSQSHGESPATVAAPRFLGELESLDAEFDQVIGPDTKIEVLAEGFQWAEGPVWWPDQQCLLLSDIPRNAIFRWQEGQPLRVFLKPAGYTEEGLGGYESESRYRSEPGTNGLTLDPQGRLVMCEHGNRRVSVLLRPSDAMKMTLASHFEGKRLNSPNDCVFASNGDLYFTDPPYGRPLRFEDPSRELDFCGVYRRSANGQLTLITRDIGAPNGIALSPDEKHLYVSQSDGREPVWRRFELRPDGSVGGGEVFFDASPWFGKMPGGCDGMTVDHAGRLFATGPGGIFVISPQGKLLGRILTGRPTANCTFGGDGSTLYIAANDLLCRIPTQTWGHEFRSSE